MLERLRALAEYPGVQRDTAGSLKTEKRLMTYTDLADALGLSLPTLKRMKAAGLLPYVQIGRSIRFDLEDVVKRLKKQGAKNVSRRT